LEQPVDTALFERTEPLVAAFADAGRREWRQAASKVRALADLPAVQEQLAAFEPARRASPDAEAEAIEAAIEVAISGLADPFRSAALDHFGYTDEKVEPRKKGEREELAAKSFARSDRWYRKPAGAPFGERTPRDHIVALVTAALTGPREAQQRATPRPRREWAIGAAVLLALVAIPVVLVSTDSGGTAQAVPPPGSVVDASNGKVVSASLPSSPRETEGAIEGGHLVTGCLWGSGSCLYPLKGQPVVAGAGQVVRFNIRLHDTTAAPVAEVKLEAYERRDAADVAISVTAEFPGGGTEQGGRAWASSQPVVVRFRDAKPHTLSIVRGSTALYDASATPRMLGRLPEGVFGAGGITLTNVGAPRSCWDCDRNYIRYVFFEMRVD
jgi:hypothetical protein